MCRRALFRTKAGSCKSLRAHLADSLRAASILAVARTSANRCRRGGRNLMDSARSPLSGFL